MDILKLRELLAKYDIRPVHARGQNFLVNDGVLDRIVEASGVQPGDRVVEIGPGPGMLTEKLLAAGAEVVAIEIDVRLQKLLEERFADRNFTLLKGDALEFGNHEITQAFSERGSYKVVANIPYSITSKLIMKFLTEAPCPESLTLMVQKEVADRITSGPGDMSHLAVSVQLLGRPEKIMNVSRGSFSPAPKVDSAVLRIVRKPEDELGFDLGEFGKISSLVARAFAARRKQLKNTLASEVGGSERIVEILAELGISPNVRPEELPAEAWVKIYKLVSV